MNGSLSKDINDNNAKYIQTNRNYSGMQETKNLLQKKFKLVVWKAEKVRKVLDAGNYKKGKRALRKVSKIAATQQLLPVSVRPTFQIVNCIWRYPDCLFHEATA
jgi:hypothetical protein